MDLIVERVLFWSAITDNEGEIEYHLDFEGKNNTVSCQDINYAMEMAEFMNMPIICLN